MQKQLVLAALFASTASASCVDSNTTMAKAAVDANAAAKAGLDGTKVAMDLAKKVASDAWDAAVRDEGLWTASMAAFVAEQKLATKDFNDKKKLRDDALLARDAIVLTASLKARDDAKGLIPQWSAADGSVNDAVNPVPTAGALQVADAAAKVIVDQMFTADEAHKAIKQAALGAQSSALGNWDTKFAATTNTAAYDAEVLKFKTGNLYVRAVSATLATGASEKLRKCVTGGIGNFGSVESARGTIWNFGSHNMALGIVHATGANAAKEYKEQYLDCATVTNVANRGYTVRVTASKVLSAGTASQYTAWKTAQKNLEARAYLFGKLRHVCQNSTKYLNSLTLTPCARADQFEKVYKANYPGLETTGKAPAAFPRTAATLGGKPGDFAADSTYTGPYNTAVPPVRQAFASYVAAVTATQPAVDAAAYYKTRDAAYATWLALVQTTSGTIVLENKAYVNHRQLTLLGTVFTTPQKVQSINQGLEKKKQYLAMALAGTQARAVQTAFNTMENAKTDLGVASDKLTPSAATATTAATFTKSAMIALAAKFHVSKDALFTSTISTNILAAATGLTKAYFQATIAYLDAEVKQVASNADLVRARAAKALTAGALKKAKTDLTIKTYLYNQLAADRAAKDLVYQAAQVVFLRMEATKTVSEANSGGAASTHNNDKSSVAYAAVTAQALLGKNAATGAADLADGAIKKNTDAKPILAAALVNATDNCKAVGYALAQSTLKTIAVNTKTALATAATVKSAYATKSARPASTDAASVAGSSCAFGPLVDGTPKARAVCAEGLCCGAANKFLRDGTKLTVETCQKSTDISYTFYPNLKAGATVAPTAEQWRFSCISGAKNLAATATAALAAAYLMA